MSNNLTVKIAFLLLAFTLVAKASQYLRSDDTTADKGTGGSVFFNSGADEVAAPTPACNTDGYKLSASFLSDRVIVAWNVSNDNLLLSVALLGKTTGWVGFGIQENGTPAPMIGAEAVVGWFDKNANAMSVNSYVLSSKRATDIVLDNDNVPLTNTFACEDGNGNTVVKFTRAVKAGNNTVNVNGATKVIVALGQTDSLGFHGRDSRDAATIDLSRPQAPSTESSQESILSTIFVFHGIASAVAWLLLLQLGALVARYVKPVTGNSPTWFKIHFPLQVVGFLLAVIAIGLAIAAEVVGGGVHFDSAHKILGLILLILAVVQVGIGFIRPAAHTSSAAKKPTRRILFEFQHRWLGRLVLCLALVNAYWGLLSFGFTDRDPLVVVFFVFVGSLLALYAFLELRRTILTERTVTGDYMIVS